MMISAHLNLVFTRSVDGDHATMQRWYNDHIGILWRCPTLQRATLYRRDAEVAHKAHEAHEADYICCYTFADEAGFLEYEYGEAREAARQVVVNGWARDGLAITQRRQFKREWTQTRSMGATHQTALALRLGAGPWGEVSRWLLDRLHGLMAAQGGMGAVTSATLMRAVDASDAGGDVLLWLGSQAPLADPHAWLDADLPGMPGPVGTAPAQVERLWVWRGERLSDWQR